MYAALVVATIAYSMYSPKVVLLSNLQGRVALVTGASRGIGRGIAIGLGEAGATVYITGRTISAVNTGGPHGVSQVGTLGETCEAVEAAGGKCVPVVCDSGDDAALEAVFDKIGAEQARLDILVNNAFQAVSWLPSRSGTAFWEKGTEAWDIVNHVGLRSHFHASVHAAKLMVKTKTKGIIINISSFGGLNYIFDVAYGIGKAAMDRMANDMAIELYTEGITMVSLWPGLVATENVRDGALGGIGPRRGLRPGGNDLDMTTLVTSGLAETVLYSGRAVSALARDTDVLSLTGKVLPTSALAGRYSFTDERALSPPPFSSVKFIAGAVLGKMGVIEIQANKIPTSGASRFFWDKMPNLAFPSWMMKLDIGAPNL